MFYGFVVWHVTFATERPEPFLQQAGVRTRELTDAVSDTTIEAQPAAIGIKSTATASAKPARLGASNLPIGAPSSASATLLHSPLGVRVNRAGVQT